MTETWHSVFLCAENKDVRLCVPEIAEGCGCPLVAEHSRLFQYALFSIGNRSTQSGSNIPNSYLMIPFQISLNGGHRRSMASIEQAESPKCQTTDATMSVEEAEPTEVWAEKTEEAIAHENSEKTEKSQESWYRK